MKFLTVIAFTLFLFSNSLTAGTEGTSTAELATTVLPTALPEQNVSERWLRDMNIQKNRSKVFYVKRSAEEVKNFYQDLHSSASRDSENENIWVVEVMNPSEAREASGGNVSGESVYVRIYSRAPFDNPFINRAFTELENSYLARFSSLSTREKTRRRNDEELQSVLRQYEFLKRSFFPRTNQQRETNAGEYVYKGLEEVLYEKFFADSDMVRTMRLQEYIEQYTNLVSEGRFDEAAKVSERIDALSKASSNPTDLWNHAINYLEELRKLAYGTLLVIDYHPSVWQ